MRTCRGRAHGAAVVVVRRGHEGRRARLRQAVPLAKATGRCDVTLYNTTQVQATKHSSLAVLPVHARSGPVGAGRSACWQRTLQKYSRMNGSEACFGRTSSCGRPPRMHEHLQVKQRRGQECPYRGFPMSSLLLAETCACIIWQGHAGRMHPERRCTAVNNMEPRAHLQDGDGQRDDEVVLHGGRQGGAAADDEAHAPAERLLEGGEQVPVQQGRRLGQGGSKGMR